MIESRFYTPQMERFLVSFAHYRRGLLPESGGMNDQPAAWAAAVFLLDGLISQARARFEAEQNRRRAELDRISRKA